ncbi:protein-L-isoaspartate O-methyltransferase [Candidatus Jorgensenbacteria bacterium CG_4_8_14_3_um_filter_38_10]|nr:MAG: protein-L-isoaspartate O-methyltransferase [Candidatus Jorgensenbacteria bacterium CG03_land_8_20_14_0_80_38_39]PIW97418.1 MAG: protein-L-isoaspartate O-methyltransferase [Candidatus Jorgensenbacteria bacterium CG_4_8_14_3_um_filter_38_10]PJA94993.1 MAG: protein-L-isoaspartate O-methyltransferase [Candidatus Jorgensenbacteria bacterium CG_4_9_14_3_um_filter_38_10]
MKESAEENLIKELKESAKKNLIKELIEEGYLRTKSIIEAFQKIDRIDFVLEEYKNEAYGNYPLPIGFGQTISQPLTVAFMLELLEPKPGEKILDVGAGSGWQTSLLAYLAGEQGRVIAIEIIPELKKFAETNIEKYNFIKIGRVELILGDGSKGYQKEAPFDKIIAAAAALSIPPAWKEQLKIGGVIVAPVGQNIVVLKKLNQNEFSQKQYFGFNFVPLVS